MKKIGILTLNSNDNYGNKLQNYALKKICNKYDCDVETLWFNDEYSPKKNMIKKMLFFNKCFKREMKFERFTKKYLNRVIFDGNHENYDYFIVGSDQVWNYNFKGVQRKLSRFFLEFSPLEKNISYAASIGVNSITDDYKEKFKIGISNIKHISVREDQAKIILKNETRRKDIEVVLDPTMLLSPAEWQCIIKEQKKHSKKKFILNYFLGELSQKNKEIINRFAEQNNCTIINILDPKDPHYTYDPSEFLYLEKNAFLICTDSFHSSVFAILFNTPFVIFDREQDGCASMGSRIDTLLSKFKLENRRFNGEKITKENLNHDYTKAYKILEKERKKSEEFLKKALDIE